MIMNLIKEIHIGCWLACCLLMASCKKDDATSGHRPGEPIVVNDFLPQAGSAGTEILINGTNFSSDIASIQVSINDIPLQVIGANDHQIMAVVPKKVGAGKIQVAIGENTGLSDVPFNYLFTRTVSTLAGNGTAGFANGKGDEAAFNFSGQAWYRSMGIAVDDDLNLYVADPGNHCIRKIDSLGNVSTFAGNPNIEGHADGKGMAALFSLPYDVAVDAAGNVYGVDPTNWDIRKITPDGTATTLGYGQQGPWSIAVDGSGNIYYAGNESPGGVYKLVNGTSEQVITGLNGPAGLATDASGALYVVVSNEHMIQKYNPSSWTGSVVAGQLGVAGYVNGAADAANFSFPWGLAIDVQGNLYVAGNGTWDGGDYNADQSIRYIAASSGQVSTFAGSNTAGYSNAIGESAAFKAPTGVCVDKHGTVYVLDKGNNVIRKIVSE